jgi:hypothetical protein
MCGGFGFCCSGTGVMGEGGNRRSDFGNTVVAKGKSMVGCGGG